MISKTFKLAVSAAILSLLGACASNSSQTAAPTASKTMVKETTVVQESASQGETATETTETKSKSEMTHEEKVAAYNEKVEDDDDRVVCRRYKVTGSHFSRTRCVTAAQAKKEREDAQEALQRASRGTNTGPTN